MIRACLVAAACALILSPRSANPQSLGEVARKEQDRRKTAPSTPAKTYNERDLDDQRARREAAGAADSPTTTTPTPTPHSDAPTPPIAAQTRRVAPTPAARAGPQLDADAEARRASEAGFLQRCKNTERQINAQTARVTEAMRAALVARKEWRRSDNTLRLHPNFQRDKEKAADAVCEGRARMSQAAADIEDAGRRGGIPTDTQRSCQEALESAMARLDRECDTRRGNVDAD